MKKYIVPMIVAMLAISAGAQNAHAYYIGQTGSEIADLQISLIEKGFDIPAITSGVATPGYFGVQTQNALFNYESLSVGAVSQPENNVRFFFNKGSTNGGKVATTSTASTYTTNARDFNGTPSVILWNPSVNTTVSLSSTSTFAYVPKVGDVATVYILNASTTAASAITFAAVDANLDLQFTEATGGDLVLNGLDWGVLTLIRQTTGKVSVLFNEFTEAD